MQPGTSRGRRRSSASLRCPHEREKAPPEGEARTQWLKCENEGTVYDVRFDIRFNMELPDADQIDWDRFDDALRMFAAVLAPDAPRVEFDGKFAARLSRV